MQCCVGISQQFVKRKYLHQLFVSIQWNGEHWFYIFKGAPSWVSWAWRTTWSWFKVHYNNKRCKICNIVLFNTKRSVFVHCADLMHFKWTLFTFVRSFLHVPWLVKQYQPLFHFQSAQWHSFTPVTLNCFIIIMQPRQETNKQTVAKKLKEKFM